MGMIIGRFAHAAQLLEGHGGPSADVRWSARSDDNSRGKVQNVLCQERAPRGARCCSTVVGPMNANHDGPGPPGAGRECFDSTRETTFLSRSSPNVCETRRAIRGQPNRGLRDLSSTMARLRASSGPFDPRLFGHGPHENGRRYLPRTNA